MRVAALGRTAMLYNTIQRIQEAGHEIVLIATCRSAPEYTIREDDFSQLSDSLNATFLQTQTLNSTESLAILKSVKADVAVSVNWINLIREDACNSFTHGILNAHAGDLPRYRGNAPVAWAMLQGEEQIGISIHQMDPNELDAGDIYLKSYFPIDDTVYINTVFQHLEAHIPKMFAEVINGIAQETLTPQSQSKNPLDSLRGYPRKPEDGRIDWSESALHISRLVRVSSEPFAGAFTWFDGELIRIWRAYPQVWDVPSLAVPGQVLSRNRDTGEVSVATGNGILIIEQISRDVDTTRIPPADTFKSLRSRLTERD